MPLCRNERWVIAFELNVPNNCHQARQVLIAKNANRDGEECLKSHLNMQICFKSHLEAIIRPEWKFYISELSGLKWGNRKWIDDSNL